MYLTKQEQEEFQFLRQFFKCLKQHGKEGQPGVAEVRPDVSLTFPNVAAGGGFPPMNAPGPVRGGGFGTFWLLFGQFGPTMTIQQLRDAYFPNSKMKTIANKHSAGLLPARTGDVYDTRDVASWWDTQRQAKAP